ncbi:MAG: MFS transporter [Thermoguttaceae bacterium]
MSNARSASDKKRLFITSDGKNVAFTFTLVSSLFLLWGLCNGMIDVMDKHFQDELNLTLSQSANVQWAHYLGYFLMSIPAGWLASKLGYKGGIIVGLLMVAVGGVWFVPASYIAQFWAFLVGVCFIASGLTFLETIANPYTTVLGDPKYGATRINLAQSCNGIGWIFGPLIGSVFFYGKDAAGQSTGSQTLWIPYAIIAGVVLLLAVVFYFADVPDIKAEDDYHLDDAGEKSGSRSIWTHPHFIFAIVAQFLYVAAQAGIFSFFINYMISPAVPPISVAWRERIPENWVEVSTKLDKNDIKDFPALAAKLQQEKPDAVSAFLMKSLSEETKKALKDYRGGEPGALLPAFTQDLNNVVKQDPNKLVAVQDEKTGKNTTRKKKPEVLSNPALFEGVALSETTAVMLNQRVKGQQTDQVTDKTPHERVDVPLLNRRLLAEAYQGILPFDQQRYSLSDGLASKLASIGFICFLIGRFTGAGLLKRFAAHRILALYGALNVAACLLVFAKLGWISAVCVFLSYFFMSIMFPTIFALGIFGLGARAKKASAFLVMAIMGGAVLPKYMGHIADQYDMSRSFIVPVVCFAFVALYGFCWPMLSQADSLNGAKSAAE